MAVQLPPFPQFDLSDPATLGPRWKKWLSRYENFTTAMNITEAARLKALLLHYAGDSVQDIFDTLTVADPTGAETVYTTAKAALSKYFDPRKNREYSLYQFRQMSQENNETLDAFHTRLRQNI